MRVRVLYFAGLRQATGTGEEILTIRDGVSAGDLWKTLESRHADLVPWRARLKIAVNEEFASEETPLQEGDVVALLPPVSGGSGRARIERAPLNAQRLAAEITGHGAGACVTFTGIVRPDEKGTPIRSLTYEIYPGMAEKKLEAVCDETLARFPIREIRIGHRHGEIPAGEAALAIAVASERREAAFEACRFAVERLKEIVPIWKIAPEEPGRSQTLPQKTENSENR